MMPTVFHQFLPITARIFSDAWVPLPICSSAAALPDTLTGQKHPRHICLSYPGRAPRAKGCAMVKTISDRGAEVGDLPALAASFRRHLLAANKAPRTIEGYGEAVRLLGAFLAAQGMPTYTAALSREHVESFI